MRKSTAAAFATFLAPGVIAACASPAPPASAPQPNASALYSTLPDTAVCVVDRSSPAGLRNLEAKLDGGEVVMLVADQIVPLADAHPVNVIAGYAGREAWLSQGEPLTFEARRYVQTGGERRVAPELLARVGEHQGILLFAGADDPSPRDALYIPTAPGCIFQPYVRDDLIRR